MSQIQTIEALPLTPRHEALSDHELGNLVAAAGNHEGKALLLTLMEDGAEYGQVSLRTLLLSAQGRNPVYRGNRTVVRNYVETFESVDLLTKSQLVDRSLVFEKTDKGSTIGSALAGHMLKFSLDHPEIRLSELLGSGQTKIGADRAAQTRISVLRAMHQRKPTTMGDLKRAVGYEDAKDGTSVFNAVKGLSDAGIINYTYNNLRREVAPSYKIDPAKIERTTLFPRAGSSTDKILQMIESVVASGHSYVDKDAIRAQFAQLDIAQGLTKKRQLVATNNALDALMGKGIVDPTDSRANAEGTLTEVSITDEQRQTVSELLVFLDGIQAGEPATIEQGIALGKAIVSNPKQVKTLVAKCYGEVSARTNPIRQAAIAKELAGLFERLPEQLLTSDDVTTYMKQRGYPTRESRVAMRLKLNGLHGAQALGRQVIKGEYYYSKSTSKD
jgi:hypothetical protein